MIEHVNHDPAYRSASGTMKAHGIISLIFGILGTLAGTLFALAVAIFGSMDSYDQYEKLNMVISGFVILIFIVLPHVFLIISGAKLIQRPAPHVAKALIITNLVIGALTNIVILIFAIISLVQLPDYEKGYRK